MDAVKKEQLVATFVKKAMSWFIQYGLDYVVDYAALRNAFLARFRENKTTKAILKKL